MGSRNTSRTSKSEAKLDIEMRLDVKRATHKRSIRLERKGGIRREKNFYIKLITSLIFKTQTGH